MPVSPHFPTPYQLVMCQFIQKYFINFYIFQVLGEVEDTVLEFFTAVKKMFQKLYPDEAELKISGLKNQQGFDIFTEYKLGDLFEDNACISVTEDLTRLVQLIPYI